MTLNPNKDLDFSYLTPAAYRRRLDKQEAKADHKHAELIADAKARGVIGLRCEECGHVHSLYRIGQGCNAAHPYLDGETCDGWNLSEVFSAH